MKPIRVLVVEDQTVVREGLIAILSFQSDVEVVGQAEDGEVALEIIKKTKPDVILLDLVMPKRDGLSIIPDILQISPESRILVVTSFDQGERIYQAIKSGALGYLLKDATREQLLQAIRDVAQGQAFLPASIALRMIRDMDHPSEVLYTADPLTQREVETLQLIARGMTNQEIAEALTVHERTVAKYVSNILDKLHLANRTQVALYAMRKGLMDMTKD